MTMPADTREAGLVAVTGLGVRVPGAADVVAFWANQLRRVESISFFDRDELIAAGEDPAMLDSGRYVPARGAIGDVTSFDAAAFGLTDREVELTDPQLTVLMETVLLALLDAGYPPGGEPRRIGVFVGCQPNRYAELARTGLDRAWDPVTVLHLRLGNETNFFATRISYALNLRGPSMSVQSGCSSSLLAVHQARRSLLAGECDAAVAAGVHIRVPVGLGYPVAAGLIESEDGHCRPFDDAATGTVAGDGAAAVVLRRLADARAGQQRPYAVIAGSAVTNDGNDKVGFAAPSVSGQVAAIRGALAEASVEPAAVGYVECHGTGTRLGDPIELRALDQALSPGRLHRALIGSVKANIGHLDAAAGVTGLIRAVLAVHTGDIPPSVNLETPNRVFDWDRSSLRVLAEPACWPVPGPRRAGVTSLGVGGTNVHVVVEESPADAAAHRPLGLERDPLRRTEFPRRAAVCGRAVRTAVAPIPRPAAADLAETVAAIVRDALGEPVDAPDFHDRSFFDLGGDSLGAIQVAARLTESFAIDVQPDLLFDHPSVRALTEYLTAAGVQP